MKKIQNLPSPKNCVYLIQWTRYAHLLLILVFVAETYILPNKHTRIEMFFWTPFFWAIAIHNISSRLSGRSDWISLFFNTSFPLGDIRLLFSGQAPQKTKSAPVSQSHFPYRVVFWSQFETRNDDQTIWISNASDYYGFKWLEVNADLIRSVTCTAEQILKDYISYYKWFIGLAIIVGVIIAITDLLLEILLCLILLSIGLYTRRENSEEYEHVYKKFTPYIGKHFHTWEFQEELTKSKSKNVGGKKERWLCYLCGSERFMPDDSVSYVEI